MKTFTIAAALVLSAASALFTADTDAAPSSFHHDLVVQLRGTAPAVNQVMQTPDGPVEAMCFTVDMYDLETGERLGEGTDCLTNIQPNGDGLSLVDYTIFELPGGTIVAESLVSVQPAGLPFDGVTHITGSFPSQRGSDIIRGTGRYAGVEGKVRLSGGVDMGSLESDGTMTFNCIFVIDLQG